VLLAGWRHTADWWRRLTISLEHPVGKALRESKSR